MTDHTPPRQPMTVEEWRALERESPDKHEYIDEGAYLLAESDPDHEAVCRNVVKALETALKESPYQVFNSERPVCLSPTRYVYPDVTVTKGEDNQASSEQREIQDPYVIVEVSSPATWLYDNEDKYEKYYANCPSLHEYMIIFTEYQAIRVWRRIATNLSGFAPGSNTNWRTGDFYVPGSTIDLLSLGITIPMTAFYEQTVVPNILESPEEGLV